jgi:hypothetical protein
VVGKISQLDLLKCLEPKYEELGIPARTSLAGFSPIFIKYILESFQLWEKPLADLCRKAADMKVKDFMYVPNDGEYVAEEASLGQAKHQLIMGEHHSLLVTRGEEIVGVLRLADVFKEVEKAIETCQL